MGGGGDENDCNTVKKLIIVITVKATVIQLKTVNTLRSVGILNEIRQSSIQLSH